MYLGEYQLGDWLPLVWKNDSNPDDAPTATIYDEDGTAVVSELKISLGDRGHTGWFEREYLLGSGFSTGAHFILYEWEESASARATIDHFTILPGGNANGAYEALAFVDAPGADYVVGQTADGDLELRRGPYL